MKGVYDYLNDIDMDVRQIEASAVSEAQKDKVKMELKRKIKTPKLAKWRKMAAVVSLSIGLSTAALFGISFTSFAQEIPLLSNLFQVFNSDGFYDSYNENSEILTNSKEDNGVNITMNEAIFDGKTLYMTYTIESDRDLGESPSLNGSPSILDSHLFFHTWGYELMKSEDHKYVGMTTAQLLTEDPVDQGRFEFIIDSIVPDSASDTEALNGNWEFQFELSATDNMEQLVNLSVEQYGVELTVKKVAYTPMSFLLFYDEVLTNDVMEKWDFVNIDVIVKDDLGNVYTSKHNGGHSNTSMLLHHSKTFEKLNLKATKLIITPVVQFLEADGMDEHGIYRNIDSSAAKEEFQLEDITFEIEK